MSREYMAREDTLEAELRASINRLLELVQRRWRTFVLVFAITVIAVQAVAFMWPATYAANAAVLLQKNRISGGIDADSSKPTTVVTDTVSAGEVNSEFAVLTSRQVLEKTARATGLDKMTAPWYVRALTAPIRGYDWAYAWAHDKPQATPEQQALLGFGKAVSVERLKESNILVVSYRAGDPRFAEIVLDELLKNYLEWHVVVHSGADVKPFFTTQAQTLSGEIAELERQLSLVKVSAGVSDFDADRDITRRREAGLREEMLLLQRQQADFDGRITALTKAVAADSPFMRVSTTTSSSPGADSMRAEVLRLELEQIRLEARYPDNFPFVTENKRKLEAAKRALDEQRRTTGEESTTALNPTQTALQQDLQRLTAERAGTSERLTYAAAQLAVTRDRLLLLEEKAIEAERMTLQLRSAKDRYLMYLDRTERARVDAALDGSRVANVAIVQQASASPRPVAPKRLITLVVSIVIGLGAAAAACAWIELAAAGFANAVSVAMPRVEPGI